MTISKILSPPKTSGSHSSPGKTSLPVPPPDLALVNPSSHDPAASVGRNKPTHRVPSALPLARPAGVIQTGRQLACWVKGTQGLQAAPPWSNQSSLVIHSQALSKEAQTEDAQQPQVTPSPQHEATRQPPPSSCCSVRAWRSPCLSGPTFLSSWRDFCLLERAREGRGQIPKEQSKGPACLAVRSASSLPYSLGAFSHLTFTALKIVVALVR